MNLIPSTPALILVYFVVVLAFGFYFARRQSGTADVFLAGHRLGWLVIGTGRAGGRDFLHGDVSVGLI